DAKAATQGYGLTARHEVENLRPAAAKVQIAFSGPTQPPRESERGPDIQVLGGYDNGYQRVAIDHHMVDEFGAKMPMRDMTKGPDNTPLLWAGTASVYFDAIVRPQPEAGQTVPKYIASVEA